MVKYTKIYLIYCGKYIIVYKFLDWLSEHNSVHYYYGGIPMGEREKQYSGIISYRKLFELMEEKKIKSVNWMVIFSGFSVGLSVRECLSYCSLAVKKHYDHGQS